MMWKIQIFIYDYISKKMAFRLFEMKLKNAFKKESK